MYLKELALPGRRRRNRRSRRRSLVYVHLLEL
jgi:hypothetical protein